MKNVIEGCMQKEGGCPCNSPVELSDNAGLCSTGIQDTILRALLNSVHDGIALIDSEGRVCFANDSCCRLLGISAVGFVGSAFVDILEQFCFNKDSRLIALCLASGREEIFECRSRPDGNGVFRVEISPLLSSDGSRLMKVLIRDVSDQRRTQEELDKSRSLYRALFEGAGDVVMVSDCSGRFIEANRAACSNLGYSRDELLELSVSDIISHQYCRRIPEQLSNLDSGRQIFFEVEYVRKDGSVFPVELSSKTIDLSGKKVVLTVSRDVSDRKRAEKDSYLSRLRFKSLYELSHMAEGSQEAIWEFSLKKGLEIAFSKVGFICRVEVFPSGNSISRLVLSDGEKFSTASLDPGNETLNGILAQSVKTREPIIFNAIPSDISNEMLPYCDYRPSRGLAIPVLDSGRVVAVLAVFDKENPYSRRDVRNLSLLVEGMWQIVCKKESELKVRASLREKETLLKEVHHRVKNNMQVISSLLNLQTEYVRDPEDLRLIRHSMERVRSMSYVHEHLYRSDNLNRINFASYIEYLGERLFKAYGCRRSIDFLTELEPVELSIDQALPCGLIINELITNAINYAFPEEHVENERFVRVRLYRNEADVVLEVGDNGVGFDPEQDREGSLGLTLVETLVSQLGGSISSVCPYSTCHNLKFALK